MASWNVDDSQSEALLNVAFKLADAAGKAILPHFRMSATRVDNKAEAGGYDPVTEADRAAEAAMREILSQVRPDDGILGEEFGEKSGSNGLCWVLDPIDGTRAFVSGMPTWGVLIAVNQGAAPKIGVIDQPYTGERFWGVNKCSFFRQQERDVQPIRVQPSPSLASATLFSTFPEIGSANERAAFEKVARDVRLTRYGADCYAYALLAAGQIDLVIEAGLQAYDIQAPIAVIEAAGGIVTDWQGGPAYQGGQVIAAASEALHREALLRLNGG